MNTTMPTDPNAGRDLPGDALDLEAHERLLLGTQGNEGVVSPFVWRAVAMRALAVCAALRASRAEVERLREALQRIAGGPAQEVLCASPTRRMEHLSSMCTHCRARAALQGVEFRGGSVAALGGNDGT